MEIPSASETVSNRLSSNESEMELMFIDDIMLKKRSLDISPNQSPSKKLLKHCTKTTTVKFKEAVSYKNRQQSQELFASVCCDMASNKLWSGANYGASAYIYKPATITDMELSSSQCLLLALLNSLVTGDIMSCFFLADLCHHLQQLRSRYLKVWMTEDFVFPQEDIKKAMALLKELSATGMMNLPSHVTKIMSSLAIKYEVTGMQLSSLVKEDYDDLAIQLENAVVNNSPGDIITLATVGGDINRLTQSGDSLLHLAARSGSCSSIAALGFLKADLEVVSFANATPLEEAVKKNNASSVKALLMAGAKIGKRLLRGDTYLHVPAAEFKNRALEALLDIGLETDNTNYLGETALVQAIRVGNVQGVEILLERGADASIAPEGSKSFPEVLLESRNVDVLNPFIQCGILLELKSKNGDTILHFVARSGNTKILKILKERRLSPNVKNKNGLTPLHVSSNSSIVRMLLDMGAEINVKTENGETALHLASAKGCLELVRVLVQQGAIIDTQNNKGSTASMVAARNSMAEIVIFLLHCGSNPKMKDRDGHTLLHYATEGGCIELVSILLKIGANLDEKNNKGNTPAFIAAENNKLTVLQMLVKQGADLTLKDKNGNGIIHLAASNGYTQIVSELLDAGVEVNMKSHCGWTALHFAAEAGNTTLVSLLLRRGADLGIKSVSGYTPLMGASGNGHLEVVKLLIEGGAPPKATDDDGWTAFRYANANCETTVADFLFLKGG